MSKFFLEKKKKKLTNLSIISILKFQSQEKKISVLLYTYILIFIIAMNLESENFLSKLDKGSMKFWGYEKAIIFLIKLQLVIDKQNDSFWMYDDIFKKLNEYNLEEQILNDNINTQYQKYIFSQMPIYDVITNFIAQSYEHKKVAEIYRDSELELTKHFLARNLVIALLNSHVDYNEFCFNKLKDYFYNCTFEFENEMAENLNLGIKIFDCQEFVTKLFESNLIFKIGENFKLLNDFNFDYYAYISYNTVKFKKETDFDKRSKLNFEYDTIQLNCRKNTEYLENKISSKDSIKLKELNQDFYTFDQKNQNSFDTLEARNIYYEIIKFQIMVNDWVFHSIVCSRLGYFYYNKNYKQHYLEINHIYNLCK